MGSQGGSDAFTDHGVDGPLGLVVEDVNRATKVALDKLLLQAAMYYKDEPKRGRDLWIAFKEDFFDWDDATFKRASSLPIRTLRERLWDHGVYSPKTGRGVVDHLIDLLRREDFPEWPRDIEFPRTAWPVTTPSFQPGAPPFLPPPPMPPLGGQGFGHNHGPPPNNQAPPMNQAPSINQAPTINQTPPQKFDVNTALAGYQKEEYSRELINLSKIYQESEKYSGRGDIFNYHFSIFMANCGKAGIPRLGLTAAFSTMLKDDALKWYYGNAPRLLTMDLPAICTAIKQNFEGREYDIALQKEWNAITLQQYVDRNKGKTLVECLDMMISRLRILQMGMFTTGEDEHIMSNKLVTACEGIPAFSFAIQKPAEDSSKLIIDLRSSAAHFDRTRPPEPTIETMFTDRTYHNYSHQKRFGKHQNFPKEPRRDFQPGRGSYTYRHPGIPGKKCKVCHKQGCWSKNHTREEQQRAFQRFQMEMADDLSDLVEDEFQHWLVDGNFEDEEDQKDEEQEKATGESLTSEMFISSIGPVNGKAVFDQLANQAMFHALTARIENIQCLSEQNPNEQLTAETSIYTRYGAGHFFGILVDTGASFVSSTGYNQFLALSKVQNISIDQSKANDARFKFGIGITESMGTVTIDCPIGTYTFHVVNADTPFLLSLTDLDNSGYFFNNQSNLLVKGDKKVPVIRMYGHAFLTWDTATINYLSTCLVNDYTDVFPVGQLTEQQLRQLHRRFGHPSASRLGNLLRKTNHGFDVQMIRHLTKYCSFCQKHGKPPGRFKFTLKDDLLFNHSVIVDIMYLDVPAVPVLHIVDEATRFQAARLLKDISAETVWDTLRECWIDTYVGPPDVIMHDAGKQFVSAEFSAKARGMAIESRAVPVEAHHSIGMVERHHVPLRRAYEIIRGEFPTLNKQRVLQMAIKAVNDTAGPDGLTPTLLVFGTYPRMAPTDPPHPSIAERSKAIRKAMQELVKMHANRDVTEALRQRNGPRIDDVLAPRLVAMFLFFVSTVDGRDLTNCLQFMVKHAPFYWTVDLQTFGQHQSNAGMQKTKQMVKLTTK